MFSSPKRFHISCSFILFSSCFLFFFQKFIFLGHLTSFLFSFFDSFLHFFLFDLIKIVNIYWLLFVNVSLRIVSQFSGFFPWELFNFFVLVCFENDVKITFQIETAFFGGAIDLRKNGIQVQVLKYVLVAGQVVSQFFVTALVLVQEISDYFEHFWLKHIFTVELKTFFELKSFFPCKYPCKISWACTLSRACRPLRACFCPPIFCPVSNENGFRFLVTSK